MGVPTKRSLACRPPAASGFVARPGDNLQLPPAMLASPAGFLRQTHAYTTRSQDSPSRGAITGQTDNSSHAQLQQQCQATEFWRERTTMKSGGYNICPIQRQLI